MSGAIERSVSKTLSSQLNTIFADHRQAPAPKMALHREDHPILARARLSKRQLEVLRLLGEGKTNKEIGEALFRSPNTIKLHVSAILKQLKLKSRTQAALLASTLYAEGSTDLPGGDLQSCKKTKIAATQPRARAQLAK
jgi:DNA-binding NarL/FixJ family response regulator